MKKSDLLFIPYIIGWIIIMVLFMISCKYTIIENDKLPVGECSCDSIVEAYNNKLDTVLDENYNLYRTNDSLHLVNLNLLHENDSLIEELFILKYKIERIKEYNRIAAQGNNIVFLRGWINRVLAYE